jgi:hypothetical protein
MNDIVLTTAIIIAESENCIETDITLVVDGFLISGFVISAEKYFSHHPFTEELFKVLKENEIKNETPMSEDDKTEPAPHNFIHLRDAKYFTPGQKAIPDNRSVFCRIKLDAISAFSFGTLSHLVPNKP